MNLKELRDQTCHKLVPDYIENREEIVRLLERAYKFGWRDAMDRQKGKGLPSKCTEDDEPKGVKEMDPDHDKFFQVAANLPGFTSLNAPNGETIEIRYVDGNLRVSVTTQIKSEPVTVFEEDKHNDRKELKLYTYRTILPAMKKDVNKL